MSDGVGKTAVVTAEYVAAPPIDFSPAPSAPLARIEPASYQEDVRPALGTEPRARVVSAEGDPLAGDMVNGKASHSPQIDQIVGALSNAQMTFGEIERKNTATVKSKKEGATPYTYDYADLAAVLTAVRPTLAREGIAVLQFPSTATSGIVTVTTVFAHKSGQWIRGRVTVQSFDMQPQTVGSALTYARRYGLMSLAGVAPEVDDDGEAAGARPVRDDYDQRRPERDQPRETAQDGSELVTGVRDARNGFFGIKTTRSEYFSSDTGVIEAARAAAKAEQPVRIQYEDRTAKDGRNYRFITELQR